MAKKARVSDEDFVRAYAVALTSKDVQDKTGMSPISISTRAKKLREKGVKLPELQRVKKETDVDGLNKILADMGKLPPAKPSTSKARK